MNNLLKLIQTLGKHLNEELTVRQLSQKAKIPYTTTYRTITKNKELFGIKEKANLKLISLNTQDQITKNYLIIAERAVLKELLKNNPMFSIIKKEIPVGDYSLVLFGSRAEGKERKKSDVDFLIINGDGKKNIKFEKFETLFNLNINPIFMSNYEFIEMLKEKEQNLAKEIISKHVILKGEEYFWNLIYHDIQ